MVAPCLAFQLRLSFASGYSQSYFFLREPSPGREERVSRSQLKPCPRGAPFYNAIATFDQLSPIESPAAPLPALQDWEWQLCSRFRRPRESSILVRFSGGRPMSRLFVLLLLAFG